MSFIEDDRVESIRATVDAIAQRESTITDPTEQDFLRRVRRELVNALALGPNTFVTENTASIYSIAAANGFVYAAGDFQEAGRKPIKYLARWNGAAWDPLGSGVDGIVHDMAIDGNDVYVVGEFQNAGNQPANRIAKWNGASWSSLGAGVGRSSRPKVIVASHGAVYVAGFFDQAGGHSVRNLAKWDGNAWSEFEGGVEGEVFSLSVDRASLYVGGFITRAGSVAVSRLAQWQGDVWTDMGGGVSGGFNPMVDGIVVHNSLVYVKGRFEQVGGIQARNIAKWDGIRWSPLGVGLDDHALERMDAIGANDTGLYITGDFAGNIGVWDGLSFNQIPGYPLRNSASTMTGSGRDLYVAIASTSSIYNRPDMIAKWDGNVWSLLRGF
jgi:trimeric autotransporter adhesin